MVKLQPSKLITGVRFPPPAPDQSIFTMPFDFSSLPSLQKVDLESPVKFFETSCKKHIAYRAYETDSDKSLVFIHGSGLHSWYLHSLGSYLARKHVCSVYCPDILGHGYSDGKQGHIESVELNYRCMGEFISFTKSSCSRLFIGGHSSGASQAIRLANDISKKALAGCVFVAPFLGPRSSTMRHERDGFIRVDMDKLGPLFSSGCQNSDELTMYFDIPVEFRNHLCPQAYSFNMMMAQTLYDEKELTQLAQPTFLAIGKNDEVFDYRAYHQLLPQHGSLEVIENASHISILENSNCLRLMCNWIIRI